WQHLDPATGCGFHLVVLDLNLPVLDGLEVLGRIRSSPETAGTPVLVVTAADQETCDEARARGADEILRKPVQLAQIREALARLL
ncbi:MAG: response regulator, partial [Myxococcota bacterium]